MKLTMAAKTPAQWKTLFENVPFHRENYYTGPLGPDYTPGGTCLRLWAPTAETVTVTLYHKGSGGAVLGTKPLVRGAQGMWSIWLPGEQHGRYYTFAVTVNGITRETGDPYARAAGVNGVRSMIVDLARTAPSGWERDVRPNIPPAQRAVWEVSVRDFSQDAASGVRPAWRGKYMAFTQQGTTLHGDGIHPTCLNYLKRLGVKYVQLMPIFDFGSVDEAKPLLRQYNWGYDPTNFNVPEGSYSTDPTRGEVRIRECREMIAALHAAGIYLTSFGLPFMQAGEEFARTKKGVGNSYRSSPALNRLDWNRAEQYHALVDYYRGLLALRAAFPRLGSTDRHAPEALQFFALEQPLVGWTLPAVWGDGAAWSALCVFYNPTDTTRTVSLPAGQWKLLSDGTSSSLWRGQSRIFANKTTLAPYSATILGAV